VNDVVIGVITKIEPKKASMDMQIIGGKLCVSSFKGIIRSTDIRNFDRDNVQIHNCFRPGDVVRAEVVRKE
jgi:exosome complex RNA-binding protein Csl4